MKKIVIMTATLFVSTVIPVLGVAHINSYNTAFIGGDSALYQYRLDKEYSTANVGSSNGAVVKSRGYTSINSISITRRLKRNVRISRIALS